MMEMIDFFKRIVGVDSGARFYKVDLHFHTPASHDYKNKSVSYASLVKKAIESGLEMIAVTDHNIGSGYDEMVKASNGTSLIVLPGVEITVEGIHILGIFPRKDKSSDITYLLHNLGIKDEDMGKKDTITDVSLSIPDVLRKIRDIGGIPVAAHTDQKDSGLTEARDGIWRIKILQSEIDVVEVKRDKNLKFFDGSDPQYKRRLACIRGSDCHNMEEIGQCATWVKMGECSFIGLKQIIHEPVLRISLNEPVVEAYPKIIGMHVTGGLYTDEIFCFNKNLNCLIGGRGAGKSAVIDFIRFCLGYFPRSEDYLREFNERIVKLLCIGNHVRVFVESEGNIFAIDRELLSFDTERISGREERVKNISSVSKIYQIVDEKCVESSKELRDIFEIEVFGQGEVFELTRRADDQLKLIDEYIGAEELFSEEKETVKLLDKNAAAIITLNSNITKLHEELKGLEEIKPEIKNLEEQLKSDIFKTHGLWLAEQSYFTIMINELKLEKESRTKAVYETSLPEFPIINEESPNILVIKQLGSIIKQTFDNLMTSRKRELQIVDEAYKKVEEIYAEWKQRFDKADAEFKEKLKQLGVTGQKTLSDRLNKLKEREFYLEKKVVPQFNKYSDSLKEQNSERDALLKKLLAIRRQITQKRHEIIEKMSSELEGGDVKIEINESANRKHFFDLLNYVYKGSDIYNREKQLQKICEESTPIDLANLVLTEDIEAIKTRFDITEDTARKIVNKMGGLENLFKVQICHLQDELVIYLRKSGEKDFSPLKDLSYGEKCTAVFSIALLGKKKPLLVDQPEDELDHAFIIKDIVEHIRGVKEKRQLVISTHNANIPVLGDAELIFKVTKVPGMAKCRIEERGAFEKQCIIERLQELEGGPEAFKRRREKYGIKG